MSKLLVFINVRASSSRCPNKVMYDLGGKPAFVQILERVQQFIPDADYYFVNTSVEIVDDPIVLLAKQYGYDVFRHSSQSPSNRQIALMDYLGLKSDDLYIAAGGDSPLVVCDHLPFCKEVVKMTGLPTFPILRDGTFIRAVYAGGVQFAGGYRKDVPSAIVWKEGAAAITIHRYSFAFIEFPEKYQRPWPWNPLYIDFPTQALQMKGIYELLYRDTPIDIFDLPALFEKRPFLANLVGSDVITNAGGILSHGAHGHDIQEILNTTDSIVVNWDGKEGL